MAERDDLDIVPLTGDRWADFEALLGPKGAYGGCWCMYWRRLRRDFEEGAGDGARAMPLPRLHLYVSNLRWGRSEAEPGTFRRLVAALEARWTFARRGRGRDALTELLVNVYRQRGLYEQALDVLRTRKNALAKELERIESIHFEQQPLPDYVDSIFEFSIGQLKAEADWLDRTLAYMETKPWNT